MCGIAGFWQLTRKAGYSDAERMANSLFHRGPDAGGIWIDSESGIGMVHRRLSIVDLSSAGNQPMHSNCGRYILVFNGEIYNHKALREQLDKIAAAPIWRGHSDTETLLACFVVWGVHRTLQKVVGMFALALWDKHQHTLTLARDRFGEKPLYYGWQGNSFLFGSELKPITTHPDFESVLDRNVLPFYFRGGYIPSPGSIYKGIEKLEAGNFIVLSDLLNRKIFKTAYWSLSEVARNGAANPFLGSPSEAVDTLDQKLRSAVTGQFMADVKLGAFLSGGVDSSTIVAIMQSLSSSPIKTFTIGFEERDFNEAKNAKKIALHLGADHTEWYVTPSEALEVVPLLPQLYDEPFADPSQIPTYLVAKLAKSSGITVALSGDGGDELFGGYSRYTKAARFYHYIKKIPPSIRHAFAAFIASIPAVKGSRFARRQSILAGMLRVKSKNLFYQQFINHWIDDENITQNYYQNSIYSKNMTFTADFDDIFDEMMVADSLNYLPDDVLVKVDRAAMGVSLETRVPLLDHHLVEWAWTLPQVIKSQGSNSKWVLRELLYRYLPRSLVDRPKMGFGVPIASWLRGPLREWATDLLEPSKMRQDGLLNVSVIQQKWLQHLEHKYDWSCHLWDVLMLQSWLRAHKFTVED